MTKAERDKLNAEYCLTCKPGDILVDGKAFDYLSDAAECWRAVKALGDYSQFNIGTISSGTRIVNLEVGGFFMANHWQKPCSAPALH